MAILKKVKAVMSTLLEISSIHEIPEAKKYLMMTFVEMITTWKAKKMDARRALIKWMTLKIFIIFIGPNSLLGEVYYPKCSVCQVLSSRPLKKLRNL
jgi:hypothetical protein